jgi:hypothetical protein
MLPFGVVAVEGAGEEVALLAPPEGRLKAIGVVGLGTAGIGDEASAFSFCFHIAIRSFTVNPSDVAIL